MGVHKKQRALEILKEFIEDQAKNAKGAVVTISMKKIRKWYREKYLGSEMPGTVAFFLVKVLTELNALGYLHKIGRNYILQKDAKLLEFIEMAIPHKFTLTGVSKNV